MNLVGDREIVKVPSAAVDAADFAALSDSNGNLRQVELVGQQRTADRILDRIKGFGLDECGYSDSWNERRVNNKRTEPAVDS